MYVYIYTQTFPTEHLVLPPASPQLFQEGYFKQL